MCVQNLTVVQAYIRSSRESFVARGQMRSTRKRTKGPQIWSADTLCTRSYESTERSHRLHFSLELRYECTCSSVRRSRRCDGLSHRGLRGATTAALPSKSERSSRRCDHCQPRRRRELATAVERSADPPRGSTAYVSAAAGICRSG